MARSSVIGALRVNLGLDSAQFTRGVQQAQNSMDKMQRRMKIAGAAIAGALVGAAAGMAKLGLDSIRTADEISKAAQAIGIGTEELSRLRYAADLSGVSFGSLQSNLGRFNRGIFDAANGTGTAGKALARLGIEINNAQGGLKTQTQLLGELADKFQAMPDGVEKSALAMQIFGKSGAEMIPFLNQGADGIAKLTDEADRFGVVIDAETGRKAEAFNDNLTRLRGVLDSVAVKIAAELLPALVNLTDALVAGSDKIQVFTRNAIISVQRVGQLADAMDTLASRIYQRVGPALDFGIRRFAEFARANAPFTSGIIGRVATSGRSLLGGNLFESSTLEVLNRIKSDANRAAPALKGLSEAFDEVGQAASGGGRTRGGGGGRSALQKIADEARESGRALQDLSRQFDALQDRLDPQGGASRQLQSNLELLDEAQRKGLRTAEEIKRTANLLFSSYFGPEADKAIKAANDNIDMAADGIRKSIAENFKGVGEQTRFVADSFAQMAERVNNSLQGLANSIQRGDFLGILGGLVNAFVQLGSVGAFGKGLAGRINAGPSGVPSFAGGGFTGSGARTGGLDGKGGFMAMLHPNETVVDHTRGGQKVHVTVGIDPRNGNITAFVDGQIAASAPLIAQAGAGIAQAQMAQAQRRRVR